MDIHKVVTNLQSGETISLEDIDVIWQSIQPNYELIDMVGHHDYNAAGLLDEILENSLPRTEMISNFREKYGVHDAERLATMFGELGVNYEEIEQIISSMNWFFQLYFVDFQHDLFTIVDDLASLENYSGLVEDGLLSAQHDYQSALLQMSCRQILSRHRISQPSMSPAYITFNLLRNWSEYRSSISGFKNTFIHRIENPNKDRKSFEDTFR